MTNFRKTMLSLAVAAAAGGAVTSSHAVNIALDGLGDVALQPYYTVRNDWQTLFHLTNTSTTHTVALKVRFQEAKETRDVLDFVLVLSPLDVWTGWVQEDGGVPTLYSGDGSCTSPALTAKGFPFDAVSYDPVKKDLDRAKEGHITIIQMGASNSGAVHTAAKTKDCSTIAKAFSPYAAEPLDPNSAKPINGTSDQFGEPLNVIKGSYSMVRLEKGLSWGGSMTMLANFFTPCSGPTTNPATCPIGGAANPGALGVNVDGAVGPGTGGVAANYGVRNLIVAQEYPDFLLPTLNDARPAVSAFQDDTTGNFQRPRIGIWDPSRRVDAVSAALIRSNVINEWSNNPGNGVQTYWVLTQPTKLHYTDSAAQPTQKEIDAMLVKPSTSNVLPAYVGGAPYSQSACEKVSYLVVDRQENYIFPSGTSLSPAPPVPPKEICNEITVFSFNPAANLLESKVGIAIDVTSPLLKEPAGWMNVSLPTANTMTSLQNDAFGNANVFAGLPVIGTMFWSRDFGQDKTKNYGHAVEHSYKRNVTPAPR